MAGLVWSWLPYQPEVFGITLNLHLILEYAAFLIAFRYYVYLRKNTADPISSSNRLSIIVGAIFGALIGSRIFAFLEDPAAHYAMGWLHLLNNKTIMGGLFGGLLGVELAKKYIGEKQSSGDLFTLPIILGIIIGRLGCFLAGTAEFTFGKPTAWITGMDLGDGLPRHPLALYEVVFLVLLFIFLKRLRAQQWHWKPGGYFIVFMLSYFGFRFFLEFLKPNTFFILGLSSIQLLCVLCLVYYRKSLRELLVNARK